MPPVPSLERSVLEQVSRVLEGAATHRELGDLIHAAGMPASDEGPKWQRILNAFERSQSKYGSANQVLSLIQQIMNPVRFAGRAVDFRDYRDRVNVVLAFAGLQVREDGRIQAVTRANTLNQAEERASALRTELRRRDVHPEVLKFCTAELVAKDYFHAVLEATKSLMARVRSMTGLTLDGAELIDLAFSPSSGTPRLAFNALDTVGKRG